MSNNKPDLMVHDMKTNEIMLVEVGITNKRIIPNTESTKRRKYELLDNELKSMYGSKVTTVPIVLTWDGLVTRHFRKYAESLGLTEKIQAYIHGQVLKRTMESVRIDLSSSQECTG